MTMPMLPPGSLSGVHLNLMLPASEEAETTSAGAAQGASRLPAGFIAASPQGILMIMQMRMNDLDGQIQDFATDMENRERDAAVIGQQVEALQLMLQKWQDGDDTHSIANDEVPGLEGVTWKQHFEDLGIHMTREDGSTINANTDGLSAESDLMTRPNSEGRGLNVERDDVEGAVQRLSSKLRRLNSGNEMAMVNLQSVVQQRSQIINLGTNLMSSLNEPKNAIIGNIR